MLCPLLYSYGATHNVHTTRTGYLPLFGIRTVNAYATEYYHTEPATARRTPTRDPTATRGNSRGMRI